jgi:uncharacterized protein (DUF1800 family)
MAAPISGYTPTDLIAHLYRRAGFGPSRQDLKSGRAAGYQATRDALLTGVNTPDTTEDIIEPYTRDFDFSNIDDVRAWWYLRMLYSPSPLREKMTLFWHGHFATANSKVNNADWMYQQNQLFRTSGFGSFRDLLLAVSQDPAMLIWLDGNSNKKGRPNENYAREVMELFTMGIGNYTEQDVREGARAFTGWFVDGSGNFYFNVQQHDNGSKSFLGHTGNLNGTDVVDILAMHPATARFLSRKLFTFFIHDHPSDDDIEGLAKVYFDSATDIGAVVTAILKSPAFTSMEAYLAKIKSPAEFIVGAVKALPGEFAPVGMLPAFRLMGQDLFEPPNVKGWPGGLDWVSTITMLTRMNIGNSMISARPGSSFGNGLDLNRFSLNVGIDDPDAYVDFVLGAMGSVPVTAENRAQMVAYLEAPGGLRSITHEQLDVKTRGLIHLIMSTAEYQMA